MKKAAAVTSFVILAAAFIAGGIYIGETDDAPGAALLGFLLGIGALFLAIRIVRRK